MVSVMSSLKHLLNDDQEHQDIDPLLGSQPRPNFNFSYTHPFEDSVVHMAERSWEGLWSELLGTDFGSAEGVPPVNEAEGNFDLTYDVQDGITHWVHQSLEIPSLQISQFDYEQLQQAEASNESPASEWICYGMIHRVSAKVMDNNMSHVDSKLREVAERHSDDYYRFNVQKSVKDIFLQFYDGTSFALLNGHVTTGLLPVVESPVIELDALGSLHSIRETLGRATKSSDATVRLEINVYGPASHLKYVGDQLSSNKVFLQRPDRPRNGFRYQNPHMLSFAGFEAPLLEHKTLAESVNGSMSKDQMALQKTITSVYASLTRSTNLVRVDGDRRLTTNLLLHQEEALGFMIQRENGQISSEYCLWKPVLEEPGWFRHAVTNAKSRAPSSEIGGGILADEMGMGKSLSILALITKTIESSQQWEHGENSHRDDSATTHQKPIRATLVLVPSAVLINEWLNEIRK